MAKEEEKKDKKDKVWPNVFSVEPHLSKESDEMVSKVLTNYIGKENE